MPRCYCLLDYAATAKYQILIEPIRAEVSAF